MAKKRRKKKRGPKGTITCKYECRECKFKWEGYRVLPQSEDEGDDPIQFMLQPDKPVQYVTLGGPGMTLCPSCKHEYIHWINYEAFAKWYRKNRGDGGCGGEKTNG